MSVYFTATNTINISWSAAVLVQVDHNYTLFFDTNLIVTTNSTFYVEYQNIFDSVIRCSAYVTAVNRAGESDPGNNVTIPSLPDIGPVIASLRHQIWKFNGESMVSVTFEVSEEMNYFAYIL